MPGRDIFQAGRDLVRRAFEIATESATSTFAAYSCNNLNTNLLGEEIHLMTWNWRSKWPSLCAEGAVRSRR